MPLRLKSNVYEGIRGHTTQPRRVAQVSFENYCFPPPENGDWHLDTMLKDLAALEFLSSLLSSLTIHRVFAPRVGDASGVVVSHIHFNTTFTCGGVEYCTDPRTPIDGVRLPRVGDALIFRGAGCKLLVTASRDVLFAAHGGLRSYYSSSEFQEYIQNPNATSASQGSVVSALARGLENAGACKQNAPLFGFYGIQGCELRYHFDRVPNAIHLPGFFQKKGWGEAVVVASDSYVCVNLDVLTRVQGDQIGFASTTNLYSIDPKGELALTRHENEALRKKGNLTILVRRS